MTWGLVAAAGATVVGGVIASNGAKSAANTQAASADAANATNKEIFNTQVALQEPFRQMGVNAAQRLAYGLGLPPPTAGQPASPFAAVSPTSGGQQAPTMLVQGPNGVFAPKPSFQPSGDQITDIYRQYLGRDPDPGGRAYYAGMLTSQGVQAVINDIAGSGEAQQYAAQQQQAQAQQPSATPAPPPGQPAQPIMNADGQPAQFGQAGELARNFSEADFQADPFPKVPQFTEKPNLPTFDQQAPQVPTFAQRGAAPTIDAFQGRPDFAQWQGRQDLAQYQDNLPALQDFQGRPELAQYQDNVPALQDWQGRPDLQGFEDLPAFTAAQMREDPGYEFRLNEGQKNLTSQYAGKGAFLSGAAMKAAQRYGQDYASNEYGNSFNRYQTTRGNKLQTFLTNRDTSNLNRANALQDYGTNQNTAQLNRTNALTAYMTNRDTSNQNTANDLSRYNTNRDTAQLNRGNALTAYNTNRDTQGLNRTYALQDYTTNRDTSNLNRTNALSDYTTNRDTTQRNIDNGVRDFNDNLNVQQQNYQNARGAYDTNFNQYQVGRTNAVNDWKDNLSVYSMNRANQLADYAGAYDRFRTNRSDVMNPLLSLMGVGQVATNGASSAAQNYGAQATAATMAAGNARAAGQVGSANAINGAFGSLTNMYQQNQLMNLLRPTGGAGSPTGFDPWQTTGTGMPSWYTGG